MMTPRAPRSKESDRSRDRALQERLRRLQTRLEVAAVLAAGATLFLLFANPHDLRNPSSALIAAVLGSVALGVVLGGLAYAIGRKAAAERPSPATPRKKRRTNDLRTGLGIALSFVAFLAVIRLGGLRLEGSDFWVALSAVGCVAVVLAGRVWRRVTSIGKRRRSA